MKGSWLYPLSVVGRRSALYGNHVTTRVTELGGGGLTEPTGLVRLRCAASSSGPTADHLTGQWSVVSGQWSEERSVLPGSQQTGGLSGAGVRMADTGQ